jgi:tRNA (guanine-N7-)-methyltransferase
MGKNKLKKFAEMETFSNVFQPPYKPMAGHWREAYFHNDHPIVLELGCGRGEYTVGLAEKYPQKNFIGVDIKGARMWAGAKQAIEKGLTNAAFLRTQIEFITEFFAADEIDEIWITFCDPQMKKATKRLTSTFFMERYRKFLVDGGLIHVKTDSNFLATYTKYIVEKNGLPMEQCTFHLYGEKDVDTSLTEIRTYYENMWLERGIPIKYLLFRLPQSGTLEEPDVEIPVDGYRSYNHQVVSTRKTSK